MSYVFDLVKLRSDIEEILGVKGTRLGMTKHLAVYRPDEVWNKTSQIERLVDTFNKKYSANSGVLELRFVQGEPPEEKKYAQVHNPTDRGE